MGRGWILWLSMCLAPLGSAADETRRAELSVVAPASWGEVLIDGVPAGITPLTVSLPPGPHVLELPATEFHEASRREVVLGPGERLEVTVFRELRPSWLVFEGFGGGAVLRIDGGPGPELVPGLRVRIEDDRPHRFEVTRAREVVLSLLVARCVEPGCLLPGNSRTVQAPSGD